MEPIESMAIMADHSNPPPAPGDRGRFTPADVLEIFNVNFLDYEFSRMWILKRLHPAGAHCPDCGDVVPEKKLQRFWSNQRISCRTCEKYFTALTKTFISGCQLDFRGLVLLALLLALGVHDNQIAAIVDMSAENVRLWRIKFNIQERLKMKEQSATFQKTFEVNAEKDIAEIKATARKIEATFKRIDKRIADTGVALAAVITAQAEQAGREGR